MDRMELLAIDFMEKYLSDGVIRKPSDFDNEVLGIFIEVGHLVGTGPAWNKTIFCWALNKLIEDEKVKCWQDSKDHWCYQIIEKKNEATS